MQSLPSDVNIKGHKVDNHSFIEFMVRWIWVPVVLAFARLWAKLNGAEARFQLLEQQNRHNTLIRNEDLRHHKELLDSLHHRLDEHHSAVMKRIDRVEAKITNGRLDS